MRYSQRPTEPGPRYSLTFSRLWIAVFAFIAITVGSVAAKAQIVVPPNGIIQTQVGNSSVGYSGDGGQALSASLNYPGGFGLDAAGNIYVADTGNNVIRMVSAATGVITTIAGNGTAGYAGDGGLATAAELNGPLDAAVDAVGNIYIVDCNNSVIRMVSASTGIITTIAGNGTQSYSGDGGPAVSAALNQPSAIALDSSGNLYIADSFNAAIRMVAASTGIITTVAGNGSWAYSGDGGIAINASLDFPVAVAVDSASNIYIVDYFDNTIRKVTASSGIITTVAGNGTQGFSGDYGPATSATLSSPGGVAVDSAGNIFIGDTSNNILRMVSGASGVITTVAGGGLGSYPVDGVLAPIVNLNTPLLVKVLPQTGAYYTYPNVYFVDAGNDVIRTVGGYRTGAPTFSPIPATYSSAQTVTINDAVPGATIYYTTDGSTPTASSTPYSGPVTVASTETVNAIAVTSAGLLTAVGTAPYTITGVSLTVNFPSGFTSTGLSLVDTPIVNGALQFSDGNLYEQRAVWFTTPVSSQAFTSDFTYQISSPQADGITFTLQNDPSGINALGADGQDLGYAGIQSSVAIKLDFWNNLGEGIDSTGVYTNGAEPNIPALDMTGSGMLLRSGDLMQVHVTYDGTTLAWAITDTVTKASYYSSTVIDIPGTVGGNTAYVGITGSTGGSTSTQYVSSWTLISGPATTFAATPTFSLPSGSYNTPQSVTVNDSTPGAVIYYTTDGTTPSTQSSVYSSAITVGSTETLNAIAVATGYYNSADSAATYTISSGVTVSVSPSGATLYGGQTQQFSATVSNTSNTAVTWSISPTGVGSVNSSGLYSAPSSVTSQQMVTITATSQTDTTKSGSATITLSPGSMCSAFGFVRAIVIDHSQVPNTDQSNFPFLFNTTDPSFATVANGGHVANTSGYDIIFSSDPAGLNRLNFELEKYDPVAGQIIAWVGLPTLSHTSDTVLYMFYGNSSVTSTQQNPAGVWDSHYMGVWHVPNGTQLSLVDSTVNGNNASNNGANAATGQIDGGMQTDGTTYATIGAPANLANLAQGNATFSAWVNPSTPGGMILGKAGFSEGGWTLALDTSNDVEFLVYGAGNAASGSPVGQGWSYVAATLTANATNPGSSQLSIYINGVQADTETIDVSNIVDDSSSSAYLANNDVGDFDDKVVSPLNGVEDEFRISNVARSKDWMIAEFNNQSSPSYFYTLYPENRQGVVPIAPALYASQSSQFAAIGSCGSVAANWTMSPTTLGSISSSGLYTAPASISDQQTVMVTANSQADNAPIGSATITLMPPVTLAVSPVNATLSLSNQTQQFSAIVGNARNTRVSWTITPAGVGTIDATGLYTAPLSFSIPGQVVTLTATSQFDSTKSASATLILNPTISVSVSPSLATLYAGQTQQVSASVLNGTNNAVTWTISPAGLGAISIIGDNLTYYLAPMIVTSQQTVTMTATSVQDPTKSGSSTITLMPSVAVSLTPSSATLQAGQAQQLSAMVSNSTNPGVTWTSTPTGVGMISGTGLYTAPTTIASQQTVVITATSQADTTKSASAMLTLSPTQCASSGYAYQRAIDIDHTKVPNADQINFPFLFNTTDPSFATTANGGHVSSAIGFDIIFSTDPSGLTRLDHELEEYNPVTGQVIAWIRVPTLSHSTDTVIYMFYGNPSIMSPQQNPAGVWDANYMGVWHVANNGSVPSLIDSTSNGNNATNNGATSTTGQIDGGMQTNGSTFATVGTPASLTNLTQGNATFSAWVNTPSYTTGAIIGKDASNSGWALGLDENIVRFDAASDIHLISTAAVSSGSWSYVTAEYAGSPTPGAQATVYVNGVPSGSAVGIFTAGDDTGATAYLGHGDYAGTLNGASDEFRISNVIRSADWISTEYSNQSSPSNFYSLHPENAGVIPAAVTLYAAQSRQFGIGYSGTCGSSPNVTWSIAPANTGSITTSGLYTAPSSVASQGTATVTATNPANNAVLGSAVVTLMPPAAVSISPTAATLSAMNSAQQFSASVANAMNTGVTWTISPAGSGTIDSTGLYSASSALFNSSATKTVTVTATSVVDTTKSASATVTLVPNVSVSISPGGGTITYGNQTQQFSASVFNASNEAITWTLSGPGSISPTGLYTAPPNISNGQTVSVTATSQANPSASATAVLRFLAPYINLNPASATLYSNETEQFSITSTDVGLPTTWSISPTGAGSISSTGLYTAPQNISEPVTVIVTATGQGASASAMIALVPSSCASSGYSYQRAIVIDHTKVPNTDQVNFPFLFSTTDPVFATTVNGGHVSSTNGYDIIFSTDPNGLTRLDHQLEQYNPVTGQIVAWVRIPTLSHATDTSLYVFYGNPSITTSQQSPTGVWNPNYQAVYHFDASGPGLATDSTKYGNNGTVSSATLTGGEVLDAASFDGASSYIQLPSGVFPSYTSSYYNYALSFDASFGVWFKTDSYGVILGQVGDNGGPSQIDQNPGGVPALYVNSSGKLVGSMFWHYAAPMITASSYNDNQWHFLFDTYASATSTETLYVDGQSMANQTANQYDYNSPYNYFLGTGITATNETTWPGSNGSWFYFGGSLGEASISNVALSGDWIQAEYNNQKSPSTFYSVADESVEEIVPRTVSLSGSQSQQFAAFVACVNGSPDVVWSMPSGSPGSLTTGGLYSAPASIDSQQTVMITATTLGVATKTATATVTLTPPVVISMNPSSGALTNAQTQQFTATVTNSSNAAVTWTISPADQGNIGTISESGLYIAPATLTAPETVIVTATSQTDPTKSASATVTLTPSLPVTISAVPVNATLYAGQTQQFTASVGNTNNTSVAWSIVPAGMGTITNSGLYTAPATVTANQTVTVVATSEANTAVTASAVAEILPAPCGSNGYSYVRTIAIDHAQVPNTDQSNFPFLFNTTDPAFASIANGGHVISPNGYDIIFTSDPNGLTKLDYEVEQYNPVTGQVVAWIRIPTLSHSADTPIYLFYGNASVTTSQRNPAGVWDSTFSGVYHLQSIPSGTSVLDSTANANNGIAGNNGIALPTPATGVFGTGAGSFNGSQGVYLPPFSISNFTVSAWIFPTLYDETGSFFAGPPGAVEARMSSNNSLDLVEENVLDMGAASSSLKINTWNHVAISYDGSTASFYIDGVPSGSSAVSASFASGNYFIGEAGNGENFLGSIDELQLSTSVRTADWIATEYNNQNSPAAFYTVSTENAFVVTPSVVGLYASQSQQLAVTGVCNASATWTMPASSPGTLSANGLYTAPATITTQQTVTVTATSQANSSTTATATINLFPPVTVTVTPTSTTLTPDQSQQFAATIGNSSNPAVNWTINSGGVGSIDANGVYSAPSSITAQQTVTITATSQTDPTKSASAMITLAPSQCASSGYGYQRVLIIDHTKVPNEDLNNFPFLFNTTDPAFASTANGGKVESSSGNDIIFSTDPNGLTKLDHELEEYNPVTGQVVAWVRIPTLSHSTDTVLYVFYGNPNISGSQQNPTGVWDSNYQGVYHLANPASGVASDSTGNLNGGTTGTVVNAVGEVDGGASLNGSSSYVELPGTVFPNYPTGYYDNLGLPQTSTATSLAATFGVWFKTSASGGILGQFPNVDCVGFVFFDCISYGPMTPGAADNTFFGWNSMLYIDDDGAVVGGGVFGGAVGIGTPTAYNDNHWHFAAVTYATDGTDTLYVDGQSIGSTQQQFPTGYSQQYSYFVGTSYTRLDELGNWSWLYFNGEIDDVSISNIPRSGNWIQTEYNNQASPSTFYTLYPASTPQVVPSAATLYPSQTQQFAATGACNATVTWTVPSGAPGTISSSGLYTAPTTFAPQQTVSITATSQVNGATIGSATVTLLPPPSPFTLAAAGQPPYVTGASQSFYAVLRDQDGSAEPGVVVNFSVTGSNSNYSSATTDSQGNASFTYTGVNTGADTIQATAVVNGVPLTSNSVSASWTVPIPQTPQAGITLNTPPAIGLGGLVGAFTDGSGTVIEPVALGASSEFLVVPAGATQLQLGVDDNYYEDNGGSGFSVQVGSNSVTVPPTAMPWTWTTGGLNNNYQFGFKDGTSPVVGATGLTAGTTVRVAYQSGTVSTSYPAGKLVNANGDSGSLTGLTNVNGLNYPTLYTTPASYPVGQPLPVTTQVTNSAGAPAASVPVTLNVSGANPGQLVGTTDSTGTSAFAYTGAYAGSDSLQAQAAPSGQSTLTSSITGVAWSSYPTPPTPASIALSYYGAVNDGQVYAVLVTDASGNPIENANVGFYVTGVDNFQQSQITDITGHAAFSYEHLNPGNFSIVAATTVNRNVILSNVINGVWTQPTSTTNGGDPNTISVAISAPNTVTMPNALSLTGTVTDNIGITPTVVWSQISGPGIITFANPLQAITTATFSESGNYVLELTGTDTGVTGSAQFAVTVRPNEPTVALNGWIGSPVYGSSVSGIVPITLAPGITLQAGTLVYAPANNLGNTTVLNANTTGSGQIGTLDTTTLANGTYWILLQSTQTNGQSEYDEVEISVVGNYKPGRLTTTVTDLVVPAPGIAINIQRNYDSLNTGTIGDFGYGWNLGTTVNLTVDQTNDVTFTLGGQRRTFYFEPQPPPCAGLLCTFEFIYASFTPEPGFFGSLTTSGPGCSSLIDVMVLDGGTWQCVGGGIYNPPGYIYTDPSGTQYTISANGSLQSVVDRVGNALTITPAGITSSTGLSVPFVRDSQGRITQITDTLGNQYLYTYDTNGNLATVTYPNTTQPSTYTYAANHYYTGGTDFRSNPLPVTAYYGPTDTDPNGLPLSGRLQSVTDSLNETTSYAYNLLTNTTTITYPQDASGNTGTATMVYDSYGMLLSSTDPLRHTTTNVYDPDHNLISVTDPLGHITTSTYDSLGNKTSSTYPATATSTNTTSYTVYNQYSEPTSTTDELGNVRTFNYDANYNPQGVTDSAGTLSSFLFNANSTLAAGAIGYDITALPAQASQFTYDANGNLASRTDALGRTTSYTYNALGQKLTMTEPPQTSGASLAAATTTYFYDALGNLTQTAAPLSRTTSSTYDANNNKISDTDPRGNVTTYQYDSLNRLTTTTYPTSPTTTMTMTYDFRNNVINKTDQAGHVTHNIYDLAGRLVSVTQAYGTSDAATTSYEYDNAGRKTSETDPLGHTTTYTFDAAGNLIATAGVKGTFAYTYDNARNQIARTDANSHATQSQYDSRKRLTKIIYPDTTSTTYTYDGPGNQASVTDQLGNVVQYTYDAANQLKTVVQTASPSANNTNSYGYDPGGNLTGIADENNHITMTSFDQLYRLTAKVLPDGSLTETRQYDAAGNLTSLTHFNGVTTTYTYDGLNRLLSRSTPGEAAVSFTYTATGKYATSTDASGTTTYTYDSMDRLMTKATPEGTLNYTFDAAGHVATIASSNTNGASVSYTYDDLNRLSTVVDNRLSSGANTTTYAYDPANNLATATYPNGLQSAFTYDALNRITTLVTPVSGYSYQFDATGKRTQAVEVTGRTLNWNYDGINRLTQETIADAPASKNGVVSYSLDPVGNRLSDTSSLSGVSSSSSTFNVDDELSSETYDNNGNTLTTGGKTFTYDAENYLTGMSVSGTTASIVYDAFGNRVSKTVNGVTTKYLVEDDVNPTGYPQVMDEIVSGSVERTYTYGLQRISQDQIISSTWTPSFYGYDGAGSVRQLTNVAGTITDTYDYDAFGNEVNHTGTTPNNYLYRGEQYDSDLGLYYLRARYYNPNTGRFLSRDPQNGKPYDPKTLHKYLYAGGDPINNLDPTGRAELFESAFIEGGSKQTATEGAIEAVGVRIAACIQQFADSFQSLISLLDTRSVDNGGKFVVNIFKLALCYYKFDKVPEEPPPTPPPPCEDPLECSPPWGPGAHGPGGVPDADLFAPREFKELQWEAMASVTA